MIAIVILCYGIIPFAGAVSKRREWQKFRRRFDELRLKPVLDYSACRRIGNSESVHSEGTVGGIFRFIGGFESITGGKTLWIQGEDLTIPVFLGDDHTWLLPMQEGEGTGESFDPGGEAPERIRWDRISTLTEGAKVFVGGPLVYRDKRWCFVSTKDHPLTVIFYDGPDSLLTTRAIRAGRQRNEYWNTITPYSLAAGVLLLLLVAAVFLNRPAFRMTVITALVALFIPLFPLIPPGLLCTLAYRRLAWRACMLRAYRDLLRLPLHHAPPHPSGGYTNSRLPGGEWYGCVRRDSPPPETPEGTIPFLLPDHAHERKNGEWHIFGALSLPETIAGETDTQALPTRPEDPFAVYCAVYGRPETTARRYSLSAYALEISSWLLLLAGIGINIFFVRMILLLI